MADADFTPNPVGIIEVCKSDGMQAVLMEAAAQIAEGANQHAAEHPHAGGAVGEITNKPLYGYAVDVLDRTAVGVAYTRHKIAGLNEAKYKSLASQL